MLPLKEQYQYSTGEDLLSDSTARVMLYSVGGQHRNERRSSAAPVGLNGLGHAAQREKLQLWTIQYYCGPEIAVKLKMSSSASHMQHEQSILNHADEECNFLHSLATGFDRFIFVGLLDW